MTTVDMRSQFTETTARLMRDDSRLVLVLADIGVAQFADAMAPAERTFNVGIREQLMIGVASGLALTGLRPIVHTIATFAVDRPYEMLKVDLSHQDLGAIVVTHGASYDYASSGRTHHAPEDVMLIDSLPGWEIDVPGHRDEVPGILERLARSDGRAYVRLSVQQNTGPHLEGVVRRGRRGTVIAVGPMLDRVLSATDELDVSVLYLTTVRPFDAAALRLVTNAANVVVVEPYLEGTSSAVLTAALADRSHRLLAIGVRRVESRMYGEPEDHDRFHELDVPGLRKRIAEFVS